jgi:mRNA interferase MazF
MQRGDIYIYRDDQYATKQRPIIIVQSELVDEYDSVILCLMTSYENAGAKNRVQIDVTPDNGLEKTSFVMIEKLFTVPKADLGGYVGHITDEQMSSINRSLAAIFHITKDEALED